MARRRPARLSVPTAALVGLALLLAWSGPSAVATRSAAVPSLRVVSTSPTTVRLDWSTTRGAAGYRVRYAESRTMSGSRQAAFRSSHGVVAGLRPGTTYWFQVAVATRGGTGALRGAFRPTTATSGSTQAASDPPTPDYELRVATWNVSGILNDAKRPKHEPWRVRRHVVARQLLGLSPSDQPAATPDVVALQEANTSVRFGGGYTQYTDLVRQLNRRIPSGGPDHYSTIDPRLPSNSTRIIYNDRKVTLLDAGAFMWDAQETRVDGRRMMAWAKFRVKATGASFFFASVHLETASVLVNFEQWKQMNTVVPLLADGLPILLGGDFNAPRGSSTLWTAARWLPFMAPVAGFGDSLGQTGPGELLLRHLRPQTVVKGEDNSVNHYHRVFNHSGYPGGAGKFVDYVFATNNLVVNTWEQVLDDSGGTQVLQGVIPSDHNQIRVEVTLPGEWNTGLPANWTWPDPPTENNFPR